MARGSRPRRSARRIRVYFPTQKLANTRSSTSSISTAPTSSSSAAVASRTWWATRRRRRRGAARARRPAPRGPGRARSGGAPGRARARGRRAPSGPRRPARPRRGAARRAPSPDTTETASTPARALAARSALVRTSSVGRSAATADSSGARRTARLDAEQHQVGRGEIAPAHLHAEPVDPVGRVPEPGGVHQPDRPAEEIGVRLDRIARRAGDLGDQCAVGAEQRIEQRRLAGVGPAGQDQQRALAEPLGGGRRRRAGARSGRPTSSSCAAMRARRNRAIVLAGKIDVVAPASPRSRPARAGARRGGARGRRRAGGARPAPAPARWRRSDRRPPPAWTRSSLPFSTARRVNSPGAAGRAPASWSAASSRAGASRPPWQESSTRSSPV